MNVASKKTQKEIYNKVFIVVFLCGKDFLTLYLLLCSWGLLLSGRYDDHPSPNISANRSLGSRQAYLSSLIWMETLATDWKMDGNICDKKIDGKHLP